MKRAAVLFLLICAVWLGAAERAAFQPSLELFLGRYTSLVAGKRVGLVTNQTGVDARLTPTVDRLRRDRRVNLVALFAPEHGIRGDVPAGEHIAGGRDAASGLPVYSLYGGRDHRPTPEQLAKIDVLLYHIQDIGCRTYTYIWHLAECMAAAGEAGIPVIVLDVPNPNGLLRADGPVREESFKSFIGLHPVPYTYALTVGELARYLKHECGVKCKLYIVPMRGYHRAMRWEDTRLTWVPTSPQIPSVASANCYPVTGPLGTLGTLDIGIGRTRPFQIVGAPWLDGQHMAKDLNAAGWKGIRFLPVRYKNAGVNYSGVQLFVTDPVRLAPLEATIGILCYLRDNCPQFRWGKKGISSEEGFDRALGTDRIRRAIQRGERAKGIVKSYRAEVEAFERRSAKYRIYR